MPRFYRYMDIRVDVSANSEKEAEQIFEEMDIIAFIRGEPEGPRTLKYQKDYPVDIVDWDDLEQEIY